MSLFFVKDNFNIFITNMLKSINENGFFVGNFLGKEDDWEGFRTTVEKGELLDILKILIFCIFQKKNITKMQ